MPGKQITVGFTEKFAWAILPRRADLDNSLNEQEPAKFSEFRWACQGRQSSHCMPFRLAVNLGWTIRSPIDVTLAPIREIPFSCPAEEIESVALAMGFVEIWHRNGVSYGLTRASGLRLYDFDANGRWEAMFLLNGEGSIEWRLGWAFRIPEDCVAIILPHEASPDLGILTGVLPAKTVTSLSAGTGLSVAFRPRQTTVVRRHMPIAKLLVVPITSLNPKTEYDDPNQSTKPSRLPL